MNIDKAISIKCTGHTNISIHELHGLQGDLKTLSKEHLDKIKQSLITDGLPLALHIWIDKDKKHWIIDGHTRVTALKSLESEGYFIPPIPVIPIIAKNKKEAAKTILIASSRYSRMDETSLSNFMIEMDLQLPEIELLDLIDIDMGQFDLEETESNEGNCDPDEVPKDVPTKAKLGDLFELGKHRLICGDSTDIVTIERLMNGEKADMVFTDPPYDLITEGGGLLKESSAMKKIKKLGIDKFDPSVLKKYAETNIFCCNKPLIKKYIELSENWNCAFDIAIYHKQNITPNYGGHLMTDLEYILIIGKQAPNTGINEDKSLYSKLYSGNKDKDNETAWSKPVSLCEKFIKLYSQTKVLDIFGGSGSTLIACEKTNRKCFMSELDCHYVSVIIERWEKFSGKDAFRINNDGSKTKWKDI